MRRTVLYETHHALGARFTEFAGWEMPLSYTGVRDEHEAVRRAAGLFDVSHMGRILVSGSQARILLDKLCVSDLSKLRTGMAIYTVFCNDRGGILDDLYIYKRGRSEFLLCVNAVNREKCLRWLETHGKGMRVHLEDITEAVAQLALQGPKSLEILQDMLVWNWSDPRLPDLEALPLRGFVECRFGGMDALIARTGFSGERGYELYVPNLIAQGIWEAILERGRDKGVKPAGLGARDTLRLEMGYLLYGNDIDEHTTPLEADLEKMIAFQKPVFIGREALLRQKEEGVTRRLVGFRMLQREGGLPREGFRIFSNGKSIGKVTSGNFSPMLNVGIGLGYVEPAYALPGTEIFIEIRGRAVGAVVVERPIYRKRRSR